MTPEKQSYSDKASNVATLLTILTLVVAIVALIRDIYNFEANPINTFSYLKEVFTWQTVLAFSLGILGSRYIFNRRRFKSPSEVSQQKTAESYSAQNTSIEHTAHPVALHHVSIPVRDLNKSSNFYKNILGLKLIERPDFPFGGAWFELPSGQHIHLVENKDGTFRSTNEVIPKDTHFALIVKDYEKANKFLRSKGIDPVQGPYLRTLLQSYFCDPDNHIIEITGSFEKGDNL